MMALMVIVDSALGCAVWRVLLLHICLVSRISLRQCELGSEICTAESTRGKCAVYTWMGFGMFALLASELRFWVVRSCVILFSSWAYVYVVRSKLLS